MEEINYIFTEQVLLELIKTIGPIIAIILTGWINIKLNKLHKQINSRMDELLKVNKEASKAEGVLEGKAEGRSENKAAKSEIELTLKKAA